jgi:hypothetical protein
VSSVPGQRGGDRITENGAVRYKICHVWILLQLSIEHLVKIDFSFSSLQLNLNSSCMSSVLKL